ncbi:DUF1298 domain-containing protein [Gordonia sp. TBRC 11910]|uniref:DUF1298 domain-containing protein n=1 Tax=Gordonia asplenii TaxID=2725283 RepID=A0A848KTQ7_9ACTN|nr:WS/DGAT domain-containing protein [Gordonia asplenii]NMO02086.1 DUF1298 domain-containing protein [Gordonia asplenii]
MSRLHPDDARAFWLAPKTRSDQFLLYAFSPVGSDVDAVVDHLLDRAARIGDLNLVVRETFAALDYPYWKRVRARRDQIVVRGGISDWRACLDDVAGLIADQVDARVQAWRIHLYPHILGAPDDRGPCSVAVLQISHALADGRRSAAIARELFGIDDLPAASNIRGRREESMTAAATGLLRVPGQLGGIVVRGRRAYRLTALDGPGPAPAAPGPLNTAPGVDRLLRVVVVDAAALRIGGHSVTAGAIVVIGRALVGAGIVGADDPLVVELTISRDPNPGTRNNFFTAAVDTHPGIADPALRAAAVAASIDDARRRDGSPGAVASRHAAASTPAVLMRWGTSFFDATARTGTVTGHTVVSSVNRGGADLVLGGGRVRFTTGFPALSSMQGMTHGVHGIGSSVAISVTTSRSVVSDVDAYVAHLRRELS